MIANLETEAPAGEKLTWESCWCELHRLRRDLHNLFIRMRDLNANTEAVTYNVRLVADLASEFAAIECDIEPHSIFSRNRERNVAWARHMAMYAVKTITGAPYDRIKQPFKLNDHNSVRYAVHHVKSVPEPFLQQQAQRVLVATSRAAEKHLKPHDKLLLRQTLKEIKNDPALEPHA